VLTNASPAANYLYRHTWVGRRPASNTRTVLAGGNAIATGGDGATLGGNTNRTWYDGVSYAKVDPFQIQKVFPSGPSSITLVWNSPPPEISLTMPTSTLQKTTSLIPPVAWTMLATGMRATSKAYATTNVDNSAGGNTAFHRVT
jgi:hypothetical protein